MRLNVFADLHTHTVYSHGTGTIEDNIKAAVKKGLSAVAIAEHGSGQLAYGVRGKRLDAYFDELDRMKDKYSGTIRVLSGMEANILGMDGRVDLTDAVIKRLDIIILGYHRTAVHPNPIKWAGFFPGGLFSKTAGSTERQRDKNTDAFIRAMERYPIDVIAHPNRIARMDIGRMAEACAKNAVLMELNDHDASFSEAEIRTALQKGAKFIIDSDAHTPENVGSVESALRRAMEAGLSADDIVNIEGTSLGLLPRRTRG